MSFHFYRKNILIGNLIFPNQYLLAQSQMCGMYLKFTPGAPERCKWRCCGVFNFEQILLIVLLFQLVTLNKQTSTFLMPEQVIINPAQKGRLSDFLIKKYISQFNSPSSVCLAVKSLISTSILSFSIFLIIKAHQNAPWIFYLFMVVGHLGRLRGQQQLFKSNENKAAYTLWFFKRLVRNNHKIWS